MSGLSTEGRGKGCWGPFLAHSNGNAMVLSSLATGLRQDEKKALPPRAGPMQKPGMVIAGRRLGP